ncbi:hypothetical protein B4U80_13563 [Leptotrombidium deliense]|uniref:C2H2-type domain-containing protein n=1 Tax=Leptotrombidium deliense TaxID=299467 RepID=A0A443S4G6_9ACAR|nr:hypothetical protein B4U80_13563 [Leptotrombidium deliense]
MEKGENPEAFKPTPEFRRKYHIGRDGRFHAYKFCHEDYYFRHVKQLKGDEYFKKWYKEYRDAEALTSPKTSNPRKKFKPCRRTLLADYEKAEKEAQRGRRKLMRQSNTKIEVVENELIDLSSPPKVPDDWKNQISDREYLLACENVKLNKRLAELEKELQYRVTKYKDLKAEVKANHKSTVQIYHENLELKTEIRTLLKKSGNDAETQANVEQSEIATSPIEVIESLEDKDVSVDIPTGEISPEEDPQVELQQPAIVESTPAVVENEVPLQKSPQPGPSKKAKPKPKIKLEDKIKELKKKAETPKQIVCCHPGCNYSVKPELEHNLRRHERLSRNFRVPAHPIMEGAPVTHKTKIGNEFWCNYCSYTSEFPGNMNRHTKKVHKDKLTA